jgi:hypothetical protein
MGRSLGLQWRLEGHSAAAQPLLTRVTGDRDTVDTAGEPVEHGRPIAPGRSEGGKRVGCTEGASSAWIVGIS